MSLSPQNKWQMKPCTSSTTANSTGHQHQALWCGISWKISIGENAFQQPPSKQKKTKKKATSPIRTQKDISQLVHPHHSELVCPALSYASITWDSHPQNQTSLLKAIQHCSTRPGSSKSLVRPTTSPSALLLKPKLQLLQNRELADKVCL